MPWQAIALISWIACGLLAYGIFVVQHVNELRLKDVPSLVVTLIKLLVAGPFTLLYALYYAIKDWSDK